MFRFSSGLYNSKREWGQASLLLILRTGNWRMLKMRANLLARPRQNGSPASRRRQGLLIPVFLFVESRQGLWIFLSHCSRQQPIKSGLRRCEVNWSSLIASLYTWGNPAAKAKASTGSLSQSLEQLRLEPACSACPDPHTVLAPHTCFLLFPSLSGDQRGLPGCESITAAQWQKWV